MKKRNIFFMTSIIMTMLFCMSINAEIKEIRYYNLAPNCTKNVFDEKVKKDGTVYTFTRPYSPHGVKMTIRVDGRIANSCQCPMHVNGPTLKTNVSYRDHFVCWILASKYETGRGYVSVKYDKGVF